MDDSSKKISLAFRIIAISAIVLFALFFVVLMLFGLFALKVNDPDLKEGLGAVFKYHFIDMGGLFSFNFHNASNVIYSLLSVVLYILLAITLLGIVLGIVYMVKRKRPIVIAGIIATLAAIFVYMMMATGLPKYWYIINGRAPFEKENPLVGPTICILLFGSLYIIFAYIISFVTIKTAMKTPGKNAKPAANNYQVKQGTDENGQPEEEAVVFEEVNLDQEPNIFNSKEELEKLIKEVTRDIVRDEIARNNANLAKDNSINPVVVQYFSGVSNQEPVKPQPKVEEAPVEEPKVISTPVQAEPIKKEEVIVPVVNEEKKPIIRIPFIERMLNADKEMKDNYNELKNEILSYGVNYRVSNSGDTFRLHRVTYIKITIAGLSLKLYFALNPNDYKDSTIPVQDAGHKGIYKEIPLVFKVKSGLSMRRCKQLIQDVFEKNGFEQGVVGDTDWVEELKKNPIENDNED